MINFYGAKMRSSLRWCLLAALVAAVRGTDQQLSGAYGILTSANFPEPYANNLNDLWTISVQKGYRVVLYFTHFDLEDSFVDAPCVLDNVEILDGTSDSNKTLGKFCGNKEISRDDAPVLIKQHFRSSTNKLTVRMRSDYSNDLPETAPPTGFRAHFYREDRNECAELYAASLVSDEPDSVGMCDHFCNNYPGGYYCSCRAGYQLHANGYTCSGKCTNVLLTGNQGLITTPGYPLSYPSLTDCDWKIVAEPGKTIELSFNTPFDVEQHISGSCNYDYLEIYDRDGKLGTFCGSTAPRNGATFRSSTHWFKVLFHSDLVTQKTGFSINYQIHGIRCEIPTPPMHGRLAHPIVDTSVNPYVPFSSVLRYECNDGYRLIGSAKLICLKDGSLSDYVPVCEVF